jgi:ADP-ribose pyrophosphatase YjhB (NUDIX family)
MLESVNFVSDELYKKITESVPLVCVDVLPIRRVGDTWQIGVITRATGKETGKLALIGGRIQHNENISEAISRHLLTDLDVHSFEFAANTEESLPFYVQQYFHRDFAKLPYGYDSSKHSIGLNYIVSLKEEPKPRVEASAFHWITRAGLPAAAAYNQHLIMKLALDVVEKI